MIEGLGAGEKCELTVTGISSEGAGVARMKDGRVVFVHRTAPGDRLNAEITSMRSRWARARALDFTERGRGRQEPPCPHYSACGGCTLQHLTYPTQLEVKRTIVLEALRRIGKLDSIPEPELHPSPLETAYRNRVRFTLVRNDVEGLVAGFHRLESPSEVLDLEHGCLLPEEPIVHAWAQLRSGWGPGAARLPSGARLELTLRATESGQVLLLIEGGRGRGDPDGLLSKVPNLRSIWHRPEHSASDEPRLLAGQTTLEESWRGHALQLQPQAFLQANRAASRILQKAVIREAGDVAGLRIVDAYCGFGLFGRELARRGASAIGIDSDAGAHKMSLGPQGLPFPMVEGKAEDLVGEVLPADLVILNPPRVGVHQRVTEVLSDARPDRIIYVSCDPATLARDVRRLSPAYRIARISIFDLFPQTSHVESMMTLEAIGSTAPPVSPAAWDVAG